MHGLIWPQNYKLFCNFYCYPDSGSWNDIIMIVAVVFVECLCRSPHFWCLCSLMLCITKSGEALKLCIFLDEYKLIAKHLSFDKQKLCLMSRTLSCPTGSRKCKVYRKAHTISKVEVTIKKCKYNLIVSCTLYSFGHWYRSWKRGNVLKLIQK